MYGRPLQLAALNATDAAGTEVMSDVGSGMVDTGVTTDEDSALYLAAGYINGRGVGLAAATPGGRNKFDGFYISGGYEHAVSDSGFLGFGFSYADLDGSAPTGNAETGGTLYQATVYGAGHIGSSLLVDFQTSGGIYNFSSARNVSVGASPFTLTAGDEALAFSSELGLSLLPAASTGPVEITPRASLRYSTIGFHQFDEQGGGPAMTYDVGTQESLQARAGMTVKGSAGNVRPYISAGYVVELMEQQDTFASNFALGSGPSALFAFGGHDGGWAEVAGGITVGGENISASLSAETTVFRSDYKNQTYRASITWRF